MQIWHDIDSDGRCTCVKYSCDVPGSSTKTRIRHCQAALRCCGSRQWLTISVFTIGRAVRYRSHFGFSRRIRTDHSAWFPLCRFVKPGVQVWLHCHRVRGIQRFQYCLLHISKVCPEADRTADQQRQSNVRWEGVFDIPAGCDNLEP